jgi:cell wall-associated NlpC family hydrolase
VNAIHLVTSLEYSKEVAKLVGVPYSQMDCWGLCKAFYRIHGHEIKDYYDAAPNNQEISAEIIKNGIGELIQVVGGEPARYGDIILIELGGLISHCAVYLGGGKMIHTNDKMNCVVDSLSRWTKRIKGYYRIAK